MRFFWRLSIMLTLVLVACNTPERSIPYNQLGHTLKVKGPLGVPLGKLITIDGSIVDGVALDSIAYQGKPVVSVSKVDGKSLDKPVLIRWVPSFQVQIPAEWNQFNSRVRAVGFQNGEFRGAPPGLFDYVPAYKTFGWYLDVYFEVAKVVSQDSGPGVVEPSLKS